MKSKPKALAPHKPTVSLLDAILTEAPNPTKDLSLMTDTWEKDANPKKFEGVGVSFYNFYKLVEQLKSKGGKVLKVPSNIVKNALLTIHEESNNFISYGFEDATTRKDIEFILFEDPKDRHFPEGFKLEVENEDLYPGEGKVTVFEEVLGAMQ
jgi:hypothetical protein